MLILNFLHAAASVPLLEVCGIPLASRSALSGQKSGFDCILLLVHDIDLESVNRLLDSDRRLTSARAVATPEVLLQELRQQTKTGTGEICITSGNRVWTGDMRGALQDKQVPDDQGRWNVCLSESGMQKFLVTDPLQLVTALFSLEPRYPGSYTTPTGTMAAEPIQLAWYEINGPQDVPAAEKLLLSQLVKSADGIISRNINRRISLAITRRLMHSVITPNQVTAVVFLIGILSGPAIISIGGYPGLAFGSLLYYLAAILDGCDGELSRLKFQGSASGAWLDTVVDDTVGLSYLLGLYYQLFTQAGVWGVIGLAAIVFYLATLIPRYYVMAVFVGSGDYQKLAAAKPRKTGDTSLARFIHTLENTVCRTDFIPFAAFVTAILGCSWIFACAFLVGAIGSAVDSIGTFQSMRKQADGHNRR